MSIRYLLALCFFSLSLQAQNLPQFDILLADLSNQQGQLSIANVKNITQRPGYDNQPYFLADGQELLYTSSLEHNGLQQTDIIRYQIKDGSKRNLTQSAASEYSPTPTDDMFSVIRVAEDQKQYLWQYSLQGKAQKQLLNIEPVGYHTWIDQQQLMLFVLGEPQTLQKADTHKQKYLKVDELIGASLFKIPNTELISYSKALDKQQKRWMVKSYDPKTGAQQELTTLPQSAYYYTWTPSQQLLAAQKSVLMQWQQGQEQWLAFADVSKQCPKGISRMAVNAQQTKIAMVCTL